MIVSFVAIAAIPAVYIATVMASVLVILNNYSLRRFHEVRIEEGVNHRSSRRKKLFN